MPYPSLLNHIHEQIKSNSEKTAIIHNRFCLSYQDLLVSASRLASYLKEHQINSDSPVVIYMRRSYEMLVAIMAIWETGAAYLPIDPETPLKRVKQIFAEAKPSCVLSEPALLNKIESLNLPVFTLTDPDFISYTQNIQSLNTNELEQDKQLAYIIYTSGSTGIPKGVMVSHDNLKNHVDWLIETFQFSSKDVFSFNSPLAFDFSVPCTIAPLVIGATIVVTNEADTLAIDRYCQQLIENKVTFVKWTPSYFKLLVEYVEKYQPDLASFRYLMVAGEPLLTHYVDRWLNVYPNHVIVNEYGPTETTVGITAHIVTHDTLDRTLTTVPIGKAVSNTTLYIVNAENKEVEKGEIGELLIGGSSVACGYYNRPDLTNERFINNFFAKNNQKLYKTGDLVQQLADGSILYIGRIDHQVKVNGYRIELDEIEQRLLQYPSIKQAAALVNTKQNNPFLEAFIVLKEKAVFNIAELRNYLMGYLPHYMIPHTYHIIDHIPLTVNGKKDTSQLAKFTLQPPYQEEKTSISSNSLNHIIQCLKKYIQADSFDINDSFAAIGITSLAAAQLIIDMNQLFKTSLKISDLFLYPTPVALAKFLEEQDTTVADTIKFPNTRDQKAAFHEPIAIIAMECRYPGADNFEEFWDICRNGKECINFFDFNEANYPPLCNGQKYIGARGILNNIEDFDAAFFRYVPKDAHLLDPQHRLFLETAWTALEKAGYAPGADDLGAVGVYASMNDSTYLVDHSLEALGKDIWPERYSFLRLMSSQFLATKLAYHLNCKGPALSIQTACSSSLVSVVLACQQLSTYQCDVALAGGVSITTPQNKPYLYQPENIFSPDGHCRPFDANAKGTVFSNGLGIVVLKRLSDALRDNDTIISVIKGASFNNDGSDKMSYVGPSIKAQAACIASALATAGVEADSIQYVEAHGTGTLVGDPIEIEALSRAFRKTSSQQQFCAIGSSKANIGHTHVAAGIAGLIKTALALQKKEIPPAINFAQPNPDIDFEHSPFYVNTRLQHWSREYFPRRAGVSAFGVGGTNAHVILEEAPKSTNVPTDRQHHALLLSAKNSQALTEYHNNLAQYLEQIEAQKTLSSHEQLTLLADVAHTLQMGRDSFSYRSSVICQNLSEAILQLKKATVDVAPIIDDPAHQQIIFLFPGQGTQYIGLSSSLYESEPLYKKNLDYCLEVASSYANTNLKEILFSKKNNGFSNDIYKTEIAHPILFAIEYSLAQLLMSFGIKPSLMLGHSLGEYVAACVSGVFSLEDAIKIVCARGHAISTCSQGEMLAIPLSKEKLLPYCSNDISIAAINAPQLCVVSGSSMAIDKLRQRLNEAFSESSLSMRELKVHYPFHSHLLEPAAGSLHTTLNQISKNAPFIPFLSNLTGDWFTEENAQQDSYWVEHMLHTVQFSACSQKLLENPNAIFIEVGPGNTLLSLLQQHSQQPLKMVQLLPSASAKDKGGNQPIIKSLAQLWFYGHHVKWEQYYQEEKRKRIPLPTYPFQRQRYWFDEVVSTKNQQMNLLSSSEDISFYAPIWIRDPEALKLTNFSSSINEKCRWLIFDDGSPLSQQAIDDLNIAKKDMVIIKRGKVFNSESIKHFTINPTIPEHYFSLIEKIVLKDINNYAILHFWSTEKEEQSQRKNLLDSATLFNGFYSGIFIAQAFSRLQTQPQISLAMVSTQVHSVLGNESTDPLKSCLLSINRVLPLEYETIKVSSIDVDVIDIDVNKAIYSKKIIHSAVENFSDDKNHFHKIYAFRKQYRWMPSYKNVGDFENTALSPLKIKSKSTYLITGGLGGLGLAFANWLSLKEPSITIVLLSRTPFPTQSEWGKFETDPDNKIKSKLEYLKQIIKRGTHIIIKAADVSDYASMEKVIFDIEKNHDILKGVFHLAGVSGKGLVASKEIENIRAVLSPKIQGTWILEKLLHNTQLDFIIFSSSLTAIAGGIGQIDYCAANIFIDNFVSQEVFKNCQKHLVINWNSWSSIGMAANLTDSKMHSKHYEGNSVSPEQGIAILEKLTSSDYTHIAVSRFSPEDETKRIMNAFSITNQKENGSTKNSYFEYLANENIYENVAQCWKEVLGVKDVRGDDNFYSLGGDSLLAIQLLMMLQQRFNITINLQDLAHAPALNSMVKLIECRPVKSDQIIVSLSDHNRHDQKAVYFIHPLGGTVLCYFPFIPYLKDTYSYWAIQDPELMRGEFLFDSIQSMATCYVNEICQQQNNRPTEIILIGLSFGGNVAVEMAAQLKMKRIDVQKIILLDSWTNLSEIKSESYLSSALPEELESIKTIRQYYGVNSEQYRLIKTRLTWLQNYEPHQIDRPLILLKAQEILPYYENISSKNNGWGENYKQLLTIYEIAGNHDTMIKSQNLKDVCALLNTLL